MNRIAISSAGLDHPSRSVPGSFPMRGWSRHVQGLALFVGFAAIFSKVRFRALWLGVAVVALLASVLVQPSVVFVAIQSALLGVVLTMMGLVLDRLIERARWPKRAAGASESRFGPKVGL